MEKIVVLCHGKSNRAIVLDCTVLLLLFATMWFSSGVLAKDCTQEATKGNAVSCLQNNIEQAARHAVPTGAVMAFNLQDCPEGWRSFRGAAGRVIVGVGGVRQRALGDMGGSETHSLTVKEMPTHSHNIPGAAVYSHQPPENTTEVFHNKERQFIGSTDPAGKSEPHENMPPFIALTYCVRN